MSTLQELVRYCNKEHHLGALLLTGEWGCGKTYLIEKELAEELRETHFIVRVSLLGIDSIDALNNAIRKQWLLKCTPFLGKLKQEKERAANGRLIEAIRGILLSLNPVGGSIASAVVAVDPLEYIPLEPTVEDLHSDGVKKRVVLVFDDLSRSKLDLNIIMGTINEYCENKGFATIVVAEEGFIKTLSTVDRMVYKMIKEKTISRTVRYIPDYQKIIHDIIMQSDWQSQEYAEYLSEKEGIIYKVFVSDPSCERDRLDKYHSFRSLTCALQEFCRLYEVMTEHQVANIDQYLCSYISYNMVSRNGIHKNGQLCFEIEERDIEELYPDFQTELLPMGIRQWIEYGIWDEDTILKQISERPGTVA